MVDEPPEACMHCYGDIQDMYFLLTFLRDHFSSLSFRNYLFKRQLATLSIVLLAFSKVKAKTKMFYKMVRKNWISFEPNLH